MTSAFAARMLGSLFGLQGAALAGRDDNQFVVLSVQHEAAQLLKSTDLDAGSYRHSQVTQQNAALVEESAAAAESLKHQAAALAQTVAVFKL